MKNYYIGVNYWDSVSGTDMWVNFDESVVDADLEALSRCGVDTLRIFPNWRDFQPVTTMYAWRGNFMEYRLTGDRFPENEFYLEPVMIERFLTVCDLAEKYGIKPYLDYLSGSELDGTNVEKAAVIKNAMAAIGANPKETVIVGDRMHDAEGAQKNGIGCIGVSYGFAAEGELEKAGVKVIAHTPEELCDILLKM